MIQNYDLDAQELRAAGFIVEGNLFCQTEGSSLNLHSLGQLSQPCVLIDLNGHMHGPTCGHERIRHNDHWDFLVSTLLLLLCLLYMPDAGCNSLI